jgi:protein-L-isoaspartate(D-aspartate) O-methyltransferase
MEYTIGLSEADCGLNMPPKRGHGEGELSAVRRAYAKQIMFASGIDDSRLEAALAKLPREAFLGPGPWAIHLLAGTKLTPDDDPVYLYQDAPVSMMPEKGLNNGVPSFLTLLISLGRLCEGESAIHIGAGQGYYTAIIAELVGETGSVTAIECEQELAIRAAANLSAFSHVQVVQGDGCTMPLAPSDVIYVNAGVARPADGWLDAMKDGGRMVLPLTVGYTADDGHSQTKGAIFLIERKGDDYYARWKMDTLIYPCIGARDEQSEVALANAFKTGGWDKVTRLYRTEEISDERSWVRGSGWSLAYS